MKRLAVIVIVLVMALSLTACFGIGFGGSSNSNRNSGGIGGGFGSSGNSGGSSGGGSSTQSNQPGGNQQSSPGAPIFEEDLMIPDVNGNYDQGNQTSPSADSNSWAAVGDIIQFGFVDWRVLAVQGENVLVVSDQVIGSGTYYPRGAYASGPISITWETSSIRRWLNGDFIDQVFSPEEQARIIDSKIENKSNPRFDSAYDDTIDKVFLLSIEEVVRYFGDSGQLRNTNWRTKRTGISLLNDQYNSERSAIDSATGEARAWMLRTPGETTSLVATVFHDGIINMDGNYVVTEGQGLRPAMWIGP